MDVKSGPKYDKVLRRKMRRQIKQTGSDPMRMLQPAQVVINGKDVKGDRLFVTEALAKAKAAKLQSLNNDIDNGGSAGLAAAKAKRVMNNKWYNRDNATSRGYYDTKAVHGKCVSIKPAN
ncbi:hypothetical protein tf_01 [Pseudomonas phage tf]|jgi:hypothetical protein|uniref:Uncharacterized protein n=1 Tax=Pseudomonas phage tf TaxID=1114179 RepID=I2FLM3_9CAUD|nr:hypothetical protein tf_01 [Pseudomonas phage tf]CCE60757.1 hypothetical protein tf_01 [Pseudomonas phage tf]